MLAILLHSMHYCLLHAVTFPSHQGTTKFSIYVPYYYYTAALFQLRLLGVVNCDNWRVSGYVQLRIIGYNLSLNLQNEDASAKDMDILRSIISNLVSRCGCDITEDHVTQRGFQCFPSSPQAVTYRAELRGTREASVEDLLQDMQQWIQDGASIPIQFQILQVDSFCDVGISSFTDPECSAGEVGSIPTVALIAGTVGSVTIVLIVVIVVVVVVLKCRRSNDPKRMDALK